MNGALKGILKIQRQYDGGGGPGKMDSKLTVIYLIEEAADEAHAGVPTCTKHWLTEDEMAQQPKFLIERSTMLLLKSVGDKLRRNEAVYPCEVLECINPGTDKKRRESEQIEGPQLVRAKSLEDQMLQQSGYGTKGAFAVKCVYM